VGVGEESRETMGMGKGYGCCGKWGESGVSVIQHKKYIVYILFLFNSGV